MITNTDIERVKLLMEEGDFETAQIHLSKMSAESSFASPEIQDELECLDLALDGIVEQVFIVEDPDIEC